MKNGEVQEYMLFETNFSLVSIMFIVITGIIILMLIKTIVTSFSQKRKNDRSPVLLVEAVIVGKRMKVTNTPMGDNGCMSSSTDYYITFEFETKDRAEYMVDAYQYGMLAEQDRGKLKIQGTRFLGFARE